MNSNQTQLDIVKQAFDEWRTNRPKMEQQINFVEAM